MWLTSARVTLSAQSKALLMKELGHIYRAAPQTGIKLGLLLFNNEVSIAKSGIYIKCKFVMPAIHLFEHAWWIKIYTVGVTEADMLLLCSLNGWKCHFKKCIYDSDLRQTTNDLSLLCGLLHDCNTSFSICQETPALFVVIRH